MAGMDFIKMCTTSMHTLDGFSRIYYKVLALEPSIAQSNQCPAQEKSKLKTQSCSSEAVVALRSRGAFAASDTTTGYLWLFESSQDHLDEAFLESESSGIATVTHDIRLKVVNTGNVLATGISSSLENTKSTALDTVSDPNLAAFNHNHEAGHIADSLHEESAEPSSAIDRKFTQTIANMFLTAMVSSIHFRLCKDAQVIPVNRNILTLPHFEAPLVGSSRSMATRGISASCAKIDLKFTPLGCLHATTATHPSMNNLKDLLSRVKDQDSFNVDAMTLLLAPAGGWAHFMGETNDANQKYLPRNRAEIRVWREEVLKWLCTRGLSLDIQEQDSEWVRVELWPPSNQLESPSAMTQGRKPLIIEWPISLCFISVDTSLQMDNHIDSQSNRYASKDDGLEWFGTKENNATQSLMMFAFDWLDQKHVRDRDLESKRVKMEESQDEWRRKQASLSPNSSRKLSSGDNHTLNMIYPTPPDVIQAQPSFPALQDGSATVASIDMDSKSQNVALVTSPEQTSTYDDGSSLRTYGETRSSEGNSTKPSIYNQGDTDLIGGDGITEDDFNFFDDIDQAMDDPAPDVSQDIRQTEVFEVESNSAANPCGSDGTAEHEAQAGAQPTEEHLEDPLTSLGNVTSDNSSAQYQPLAQIDSSIAPSASSHPALSPDIVRRGIFSTSGKGDGREKGNRHSANITPSSKSLDSVSFNPVQIMSDRKYQSKGRFGYSLPRLNNINTSKIPKRGFESFSPARWTPTNSVGTHRSEPNAIRRPSIFDLHKEEMDRMVGETSSESDSEASNSTHSGAVSNKHLHHDVKSKANQLGSTGGSPVDDTFPESLGKHAARLSTFREKATKILEQGFNQSNNIQPRTEKTSEKDAWSVSMKLLEHFLSIKASDRFSIADIVTAQISSTAYSSLIDNDNSVASEPFHKTEGSGMTKLRDALTHILGSTSQRDFTSLIKGFHKESPTTQSGPFDNDGNPIHDELGSINDHLFSIPAPMVRTLKSDILFDLLPSALPFWEAIGLGPAHGAKDTWSYCLYPSNESLSEDVKSFMTAMTCNYEDCKLGSHTPGPAPENGDDGLVPVQASEPLNKSSAVRAIAQSCSKLGKHLAIALRDDRPIVVYLINPFPNHHSLQIMSTCFYALLQTYKKQTSRKSGCPSDRILLQIIPIGMVSSQHVPVFPDPAACQMLARGIYDRIKPKSGQSREQAETSAIELSEPLPTNIPFEISDRPPRDLLHEESCLHLAYAWSRDKQWMRVAWSDNIGRLQTTGSYMMDSMSNFPEVAHEIWATTLGLVRSKQVTWRVFLASVGHMHQEEHIVWGKLIGSLTSAERLQVTLVSTTPCPILVVEPKQQAPVSTVLASSAAAPPVINTPNSLTTPVSTPQAHATSPAPNTASPGAEYIATPGPTAGAVVPAPLQSTASGLDDTATRLIDITDESWGALLSEPLSISDSPFQWRPALASGMLLKRGGSGDLDRPILMEVSIVAVPGAVKTQTEREAAPGGAVDKEQKDRDRERAESTVKELLVMYRGLGLLARVRGITDPVKSILPWHIAVAMKGAEALSGWLGSRP